jgi:hypothetical protein
MALWVFDHTFYAEQRPKVEFQAFTVEKLLVLNPRVFVNFDYPKTMANNQIF